MHVALKTPPVRIAVLADAPGVLPNPLNSTALLHQWQLNADNAFGLNENAALYVSQALAAAAPADIPGLLPNILNCIRTIWTLSKFYNTEERLSSLLRKISNQIIHRCAAANRDTTVCRESHIRKRQLRPQ